MTYGIEARNRSNNILFNSVNLPIEKVGEGLKTVAYHDSDIGTDREDSAYITLPQNCTIYNTLIFAKPHITEEFLPTNERAIDRKIRGFFPMAVEFRINNGNHQFRIIAPDNARSYYNNYLGSPYTSDLLGFALNATPNIKILNNSFDNWSNGQLAKAEYQIWKQAGLEDTEQGDYGIRVLTEGQDLAFSTARNYFIPESIIYNNNPLQFVFNGSNSKIRETSAHEWTAQIFMKNTTHAAQTDYYVFLNPHTTAIAKGGNREGAGSEGYQYEIPKDRTAFYKYFVEFHYSYEGGNYRPLVRMTHRLAYTRDTSATNAYDNYIRANGDVGVGGLLLLGRPS